MTTDTDALIQTVRTYIQRAAAALHQPQPGNATAALDALAAELRDARYMAERWPDKAIALKQRAEAAEAARERLSAQVDELEESESRLQAELEQARDDINQLGRDFEIISDARQEQRAELERVKAERDEFIVITNGLRRRLARITDPDILRSEGRLEWYESLQGDMNDADFASLVRDDSARLDKALAALREIAEVARPLRHQSGRIARAAIAEMEEPPDRDETARIAAVKQLQAERRVTYLEANLARAKNDLALLKGDGP